ncbi:MAG: glycosyltransferase [Patescibacteria group bacterium]|nr:glycosyltransferase [Patescibacteria group bacterium]
MKKPFFSIIIPTLNEEKYLPKLIKSLKNQKEKSFEVIVVDGGSIDKTEKIVYQFKKSLKISFFKKKKKNVSYQRNFGAKKAKGKYLIFLDADSEVSLSFCKNLKRNIERKKGLFFIPYLLPDFQHREYKVFFRFINLLIEFSQNFKKPFSAGGAMIIEKNFFHILGGFNENLFISEDHNLVWKAYQWGVRAKFLKDVKVKFSLRRLRKEGSLKLFYKYLLAAGHYIFKGDVKDKIFDYQMGGQFFEEKKKNVKIEDFLKKYFQSLKNIFTELLKA